MRPFKEEKTQEKNNKVTLTTHPGAGGEGMRRCDLGLALPVRKVASVLRVSY